MKPQPQLNLPHYLRLLLLEKICEEMDITAYLNDALRLGLAPEKGSHYKGSCPICRQKEAFAISKKIGSCTCKNCKMISDFLDLLSYLKNYDLNQTLEFLSGCLEKAAYGICAAAGGRTSIGGVV